MVSYEIKNVVPYTDVYYVDCVHLCFLTAVKCLNGSISSCIANDYFVYNLSQAIDGLILRIIKLQVKSPQQIAEDSGIGIDYQYEYGKGIIDSIIDVISHESIAVIPIDGFYYNHPHHDLFYLKEHHYQMILIYGYDCDKQVFKTVDVNGFEWNTKKFCYKHEMSFETLIQCHEGIINFDRNMPTIIKCSKDNSNKEVSRDPHFCQTTMIKNLLLHKNEILSGLQSIYKLSENIEQFTMDKHIVFNNKIASLSNQYKIKSILGSEYSNDQLLSDIIDCWVIIEALILKNEFKGTNDKKKFIPKLKKLFEMESKLYDELFSQIENTR